MRRITPCLTHLAPMGIGVKETKEIIELRIEPLKIMPMKTIPLKPLKGETIKTESGDPAVYIHTMGPSPQEGIKLEITPVIIEKIRIRLKIRISYEGKIIKEETVFTRNLEPVVVELLEKRDEHVKLAHKITPEIQIIEPAMMYPWPVEEIEMGRVMLLRKVNDHYFINDQSVYYVARRPEDRPIFFYFFIKGKGIYVLSFKPFEGAEPLGVVRSNIIKIKHNEDYFEWISRSPFLPEGKWLVWVRNNPDYDPVENGPEELRRKMRHNLKKKYMTFMEIEWATFVGIGKGEELLKKFFKYRISNP